MKRSELKTGMNIHFADGDTGTVLLGTANGDIIAGKSWMPLNSLNYYLADCEELYKIDKVKQPKANKAYLKFGRNAGIIWERKEDEMIDIDGKKWSLGTVKEALRKHAK